jgi:hypothetical protein
VNTWLFHPFTRHVGACNQHFMSANTCTGKPSPVASSLVDRGILHLPRVSFLFFSRQYRGWNLVCSLLISFEFPHLHSSLFLARICRGGMDVPMPPMVSSRAHDVESVAILAPSRGDAEGLIRKVALLECELEEACPVWDVAGERVHRLSNSSAESSLRSFSFCGLGASSCAFPSSACRRPHC